ncbi:hypothetical protein EMIT0111MI5_260033 [Burkholderia sp. IT-111MI5]
MDVVPQARRPGALPDRRYVVADRDGRPHDHAAAGRDADRARFVHAAAAGHHGGRRRRDGPGRAERARRHPRRQAPVAGNDPHDLGRPGAFQEELLPRGARWHALSGRRRHGARQGHRLLHDHGPDRRRAERVGPPARHDGDRVGAGVARARCRGGRGRPAGRHDGRGGRRVRGAEAFASGRRGSRGAREDAARLGRQADRTDREAEGHPLRRQPAEDTLGQDHAAPAALAREGRGDHAGHVHAREPGHPRSARRSALISPVVRHARMSPCAAIPIVRAGAFC